MTSLARRLARPEILALPTAQVLAGAGGEDGPEILRLHLNESCFSPLVMGPAAADANRYPEPGAPRLSRAMASLYGVEPGQLFASRGADDAIDALIRTFCRSGIDSIAIHAPTFGAYSLFAQIQGARIVEVPLAQDFEFDAERFANGLAGENDVKLAFLCSPNNPTGNLIPKAAVLRLLDLLPETIIVLDEAYIEFSDAGSLAAEAAGRDNLVVLRTLSKAYGIAGARVGCAIANAELISIVARALPPFPLSSASIAIALDTLSPSRRLLHDERIKLIRAERERMAARLGSSPLVKRVWPSQANFLMIDIVDPQQISAELAKRGIKVRYRPDIGPGVLRLTIGTPSENELALSAFGIEAASPPVRRAEIARDTKETKIALSIDLDRPLPRRISSGLPFFDHMLDQVAAHGGFSLLVACEGDLEVDAHHSVEDIALAFGKALGAALGTRRGIGRFGFALPMDEASAQALIDLSGRPFCRFEGKFSASHIGTYPTEMTAHVFRSVADALGASIHIKVEGENDHHKTEACFKAFGRALGQAIALEGSDIPSTKGLLA